MKREKGAAGAAATLTEGPARWDRETTCPAGPLAIGVRYLRPLRSGGPSRSPRLTGPNSRVRPKKLGLGARSCASGKVAHLQTP